MQPDHVAPLKMRLIRLPAVLFFIGAAAVLIRQGSFDIIAVPAIIFTALCAILALTKHQLWAMTIGVGLAFVSLMLQIYLNYWCSTCLTADVFIMTAVIYLAFTQQGPYKKQSFVMGGLLSVVLVYVVVFPWPGAISAVTHNENMLKIGGDVEMIARREQKPVLLFNPHCEPCQETVAKLIKLDPKGAKWLAMQSGGQANVGADYLRGKGYQGKIFYTSNPTAVPALVTIENNKLKVVRGEEQIIMALQANLQ